MMMYEIVSRKSDVLILRSTYKLLGFIYYCGLMFVVSGFSSVFLIPQAAFSVIPFNLAVLMGLFFLRYRNRLLIFDRRKNSVSRKNDLFGWIYHERVLTTISEAGNLRIQGRIVHGRSTSVAWEVEIRSRSGFGVPLFEAYRDLLPVKNLADEIAGFIGVGIEEIDETGKKSTYQPSNLNSPFREKIDSGTRRSGTSPSPAEAPSKSPAGQPNPVDRPPWVRERTSGETYEAEASYRKEYPGGWQIPTVFLALLFMDLYGWIAGKNHDIKPIGLLIFIAVCIFFITYNRRARTAVTLDKSAVKVACSTLLGDEVHWIPLSDLENITMEATSEHYGKLHFICKDERKSVSIGITNLFGHYLEYRLKTLMPK